MSNEKQQQIEEMAKVLSTVKRCDALAVSECIKRKCEYPHFDGITCIAEHQAEALFKAGYRKQKEGHWIPSPDGINPIRCSECNMPAPFAAGENEFGDFGICRYPSRYCPNCGAKMKGGE